MKLYSHFIEQTKKFPNATALVCGDRELSYQDLDTFSSRLSDEIVKNGFKPGQRAAIYLEKSLDSIVCMLAVLKAGGIYVPIDYSQPYKRVSYILNNCEVSLVFAHQRKIEELGQELTLPPTLEALVSVGYVGDGANAKPFFRLEKSPNAQQASPNLEDLVFLLYTSGSTGVPKGVKISYQNASVFLDWCRQEMDIKETDSVLNLAGFHFDLSVFDIYLSLSVGARLIINQDKSMINPFEICKTIEKKSITVIYCVPSLLTLLLSSNAAYKYNLSSLRYVLFAGETFPIKYLKELKTLISKASFYNLYGPTETNVCSYFKVDEIPEDRVEPVPIGIAVSGASLYALNEEGKIIKDGEIGELYAKGPCVTPGYWNYNDARNAENHKNHIHATGDLVSLENWNYVYHGRKDNQIKLKGYRIELDEIESHLVNHSEIKECAVILANKESNPHLVACVVPVNGNLNSSELREYCGQQLPGYMIPSYFKIMESLPKNSNGKIDRIKLKESLA